MTQVRGYGGFKPLLLITWALEEVRARSSPPVAPRERERCHAQRSLPLCPRGADSCPDPDTRHCPHPALASTPQHLNTSTLSSHTPLTTPLWTPLAAAQVRETLESDEAVQDGHAVPLAANLTWARFQVARPPTSTLACPPTHQPNLVACPPSTSPANLCNSPELLHSANPTLANAADLTWHVTTWA